MPKETARADAADVLKTGTRFSIQVTEKDIARAHHNDSYKCVVAQAIARTITDAHHIEVDTQTIRFSRDAVRYVFLTPVTVQGYVIAFDAGDPIEPFKFQLRDPIPARRFQPTAKGKAAHRAKQRALRTVRKRAKLAGLPLDAPEVTAEANAAASDAYHATLATIPGPAVEPRSNLRTAPPRVFKTKQRSYGHRLLRINRKGVDAAKSQEATSHD